MTDIAAAALKLATGGHPVIPLHHIRTGGRCSCGRGSCTSPGKHPRTPHGVLDASAIPAVVVCWWRRWKLANIGLATGQQAGLLVIDLDGEQGIVAFDRLVANHEPLPTTRWAVTGGGGRHVYLRHPGGDLGNSCRRLGPGIDTRGDGGFVVCPPSTHASGRPYQWLNREKVAACPPWLVALLRPPVPPARPPALPLRRTRGDYARAALAGEEARVRMAPVGTRNHTLNAAAFSLGQLVADGALNLVEVAGVLLAAALSAGLGETESRRTIESGMAAGQREPRGRTA